jgi:hypothetical protein
LYEDHLNSLKMMIEGLLESDFFYGLYCEGSSGIGKTTLVSTILSEKEIPFVTLSSYSTPLNFFNCLHDNCDDIVLLDDCKGIIESPGPGISLLKAALSPCGHSSAAKPEFGRGGGQRILRWGSTTNKAAASEFEFRGRLIIISNTQPVHGEDGAAFRNRCLSFKIYLDRDERLQMLARAARTPAEKAVYSFLEKKADSISTESLNYRTFYVGASLFKTHNEHWRKLFLLTLPENQKNPLKIIRELAQTRLPVEQQYLRFHALTQRSRRSFFRYREECGLRKYCQNLEE